MTDYTDIIARLEKATEPDRELDRDIARAFETFPTEPFEGKAPFKRLEGMYWVFGKKDTPHGQIEEKWSKNPPLYTSSLDAALTLVPEGEAWCIVRYESGTFFAEVGNEQSTAPTLAIALCIAALKARAAS